MVVELPPRYGLLVMQAEDRNDITNMDMNVFKSVNENEIMYVIM